MVKKSKLAKNEQRKLVVEKYTARRKELKKIIDDKSKSDEEHDAARAALGRLPRDANPIRLRNRCNITGRPRANYRKFGLCRNKFRELALLGEIPGVRKASW